MAPPDNLTGSSSVVVKTAEMVILIIDDSEVNGSWIVDSE